MKVEGVASNLQDEVTTDQRRLQLEASNYFFFNFFFYIIINILIKCSALHFKITIKQRS